MGPFVGRGQELAALDEAVNEARGGESRIVVVVGEPGVGKSSLLNQWLHSLPHERVLSASGDEGEQLLPYGVVAQILSQTAPDVPHLGDAVDPLVVGGDLLDRIGTLQEQGQTVVLAVDDLHWADGPSARALLFVARRLQADSVLVALTVRPGDLPRLGENWLRFFAGSYRCRVLRLGGLDRGDLGQLAAALGVGVPSQRALARLVEEAGGVPLYCRAILEEMGAEGLDSESRLHAPPSLAAVIGARLRAVPEGARALVSAAAVLGTRCEIRAAATVADLADPSAALNEAVAAGLLTEEPDTLGSQLTFTHALIRHAVYDQLGPVERRRLHAAAAQVTEPDSALTHRVEALTVPQESLASDLEAAARRACSLGNTRQGGTWLAQAAWCSTEPQDAERRLLDALEVLATAGEVADAEALVPRVERLPRSARQLCLLGTVDLMRGRPLAAESRLLDAWALSEEPGSGGTAMFAALQMATLMSVSARIPEGVKWAERAAQGPANSRLRNDALGIRAIMLAIGGRGVEGLRGLTFLPESPAAVPLAESDPLVARGMARMMIEDLEGAISDLATAAARQRRGVPMRLASQCLACLADAEYRRGHWDDAAVHADLAVSLADSTGRSWDLPFVHGVAAYVPAARGDFATAAAHVAGALEAARAFGAAEAVAAAATAEARLAFARSDLDGVVSATASVRATGRAEYLGQPGHYDWRALEVAALLGLDERDRALSALIELEGAVRESGPASHLLEAARLRGELSLANGDLGAATASFSDAWRYAEGLHLPLPIAFLEISDSRRLRQVGAKDRAVAALRSARARLLVLGAAPWLGICDRELLACGVHVRPGELPDTLGLTTAELAVARLVAQGRTNREVAAELFVTVKTVEFHLGHIFGKLSVSSRRELLTRLAPTASRAKN